MKTSPLLLDSPEYAVVEVRAFPHSDEAKIAQELPISLRSRVTYADDGTHFAIVGISQKNQDFAYTFEVDVFTTFRIDIAACKSSYKNAFNPAVVATNVARILYSSAREMLAIISSRGPHGLAVLPSIVIEPSDVRIDFSGNKRDLILRKFFGFTPQQIADVNQAIEGAIKSKKAAAVKVPKKKSSKTSTNKPANKVGGGN